MTVIRFRRRTAVLFAAYILLICVIPSLLSTTLFSFLLVDLNTHITPDYKKEDLTAVLSQEEWSQDDFDLLYRQTGLSPSALLALKASDTDILQFQDALYYDGPIIHTDTAGITPHCVMDGFTAPIAPLENGDILVTASCHTLGYKNGHAAIVVNAKTGSVLEASNPGHPSQIGNVKWFQHASNFLVLRLKDASPEERNEIAQWALSALYPVDYSLFVGFFSPKDQGDHPTKTHCSHLVWQAYYHFGYDLDSDGGPLASVRDVARSPLLETVQVYGFDVGRRW